MLKFIKTIFNNRYVMYWLGATWGWILPVAYMLDYYGLFKKESIAITTPILLVFILLGLKFYKDFLGYLNTLSDLFSHINKAFKKLIAIGVLIALTHLIKINVNDINQILWVWFICSAIALPFVTRHLSLVPPIKETKKEKN